MPGLNATLRTRRRFSLNWPYLGAITGQASAIDLEALALRNLDDARQFAREYGFDVDRPYARRRLDAAHAEAVQFIASTFLSESQRRLLPTEISRPDDVLELLVMASRHAPQYAHLRAWACAVLKVMHGVFYIDNDLKLRHFAEIRRQVFDSLDALVQRDGDCWWLTDGELCLPLVQYDKKSNKGRRSILLKLLQKAEYVAADIYDHLGVRMTFDTRFECLLALQLLQRAHLVSATNVESHRTRNTLLDLDAAKQVFVRYRAVLDRTQDYPTALLRQIDAEMAAISAPAAGGHNPHSGAGYQSLQITVRKMIHLPSDDLDDDAPGASFFFSYEIQLLDRAGHERTQDGPASHAAYKQRQVETARRRVLGPRLIAWLASRDEPAPTSAPARCSTAQAERA